MGESYKKLYQKQAAFYLAHPRAKKILFILNYGLTGLIFLCYALLCLAVLLNFHALRTTENLLKIFGAPLFCLIVSSLLRKIINRPRPYEHEGIVPVIAKNKKGNSFPSRHLSSAFSIATVFLPYFLPVGICLYIAGLLLGYARFAAGIHYFSDLAVGALLGAAFGLLIFL
jgi:membrane-associated phospholipid phosphatase